MAEDVQHGVHDFGADPVTVGDRDGAEGRHGGRGGMVEGRQLGVHAFSYSRNLKHETNVAY